MTTPIRKFDTGATRNTDTGKLTELAWAAGFFDGEGSTCCTTNNGKRHTRVQVSIGQKNDSGDIAEVLFRFQSAVDGIGNIYRKSAVGKDIDQHQFLICKLSDVKKCLNLLWPYLSGEKRRQAHRADELFFRATGKSLFNDGVTP